MCVCLCVRVTKDDAFDNGLRQRSAMARRAASSTLDTNQASVLRSLPPTPTSTNAIEFGAALGVIVAHDVAQQALVERGAWLALRAADANVVVALRRASLRTLVWRADGALRRSPTPQQPSTLSTGSDVGDDERIDALLARRAAVRRALNDAAQRLANVGGVGEAGVTLAAHIAAATSGTSTGGGGGGGGALLTRHGAECDALEDALVARLAGSEHATSVLSRAARRRERHARLTRARAELLALCNAVLRVERQRALADDAANNATSTSTTTATTSGGAADDGVVAMQTHALALNARQCWSSTMTALARLVQLERAAARARDAIETLSMRAASLDALVVQQRAPLDALRLELGRARASLALVDVAVRDARRAVDVLDVDLSPLLATLVKATRRAVTNAPRLERLVKNDLLFYFLACDAVCTKKKSLHRRAHSLSATVVALVNATRTLQSGVTFALALATHGTHVDDDDDDDATKSSSSSSSSPLDAVQCVRARVALPTLGVQLGALHTRITALVLPLAVRRVACAMSNLKSSICFFIFVFVVLN